MGLGSILLLVYGASVATYNASVLVPSLALMKKIKKDGYVSTGKEKLSSVTYNKVFSSNIAFDGEEGKWSLYALIPGANTLLALAGVALAISNRDKYMDYTDLEYRGFIKKDSDGNDKKDNSGTSKKEIESAKSNNNGNVKQMTRSEIIAALKAERDKLCSKDNSLGKTKKITIK